MDARSGTELQYEFLERHADARLLDRVQITLSLPESIPLHPAKPNILWQKNAYSFPGMAPWFRDKANHGKYDAYVFNSHWSYEKFRLAYEVPTERCHVIKNGTVAFPDRKPHAKGGPIRMLFHPTPWRGLGVLLDAMQRVTTPNLMLDVYSSTAIYGAEFQARNDHKYQPLYEQADRLPNCTYVGYKPHTEILAALPDYHVFPYPSIWEESFCIAALEAMGAGLDCILTDFGALPETGAEFARYVPIQDDRTHLAHLFARAIDATCARLHEPETAARLSLQQQYVRAFYNWEHIGAQWDGLLADVVGAKEAG